MAEDINAPSQQAIMQAYQVTARIFATESQLIWRRTGLFLALNSLVAAALNYVNSIPATLRLVIPFVGVVYAVAWLISMRRMWQYHQFYIYLMHEQEKALALEKLGPYLRGKKIAEGTPDQVGGTEIKFTPATLIFRARFLSDVTIWLFIGVYILFIWQYFSP